MPDPVTLFSCRLILRPWLESDREPFAALNADPQVMEFYPSTLTRPESDAMVDRIQARFDESGWGLWAVEMLRARLPDQDSPQETSPVSSKNSVLGISDSSLPQTDRPQELSKNGPFIGYVGLSVPRFEAHFTPCVEIGWRLAREFWGRGLATEAARVACRFGFEQLGFNEIVSFTAATNERSRRVMRRLGMTHDPEDDFDHPSLPEGHPLRRHVFFRLANPAISMENSCSGDS